MTPILPSEDLSNHSNVPIARSHSILFSIFLLFLRLFRWLYRWAKRKWPGIFETLLAEEINLDTSRMLRRFNRLHRFFFRNHLEEIRFNESDLTSLKEAFKNGPVVFLMRHWGQVEYNYYNHLFLKKDLPLVTHNNMVKMGHWMPYHQWKGMALKKIDHFMISGTWPDNEEIFSLSEALHQEQPVLFCLNLPKGAHWLEESYESQQQIYQSLLEIQKSLHRPLQLIPLHFIYDKHPGHAKRSLGDILFGEKENPGLLRKIFLFLRNFKKRAVAKIGEPLSLPILASEFSGVAPELFSFELAKRIQKEFNTEAKQVTGPKLKSRRSILTQILNNPKVRLKIRSVSDEEKTSFESAEKRTLDYLREIASDIRFTTIELWDFFLSWLFHTIYDGIEIDEEGLQKIKKIAKNTPLVLLPSHKSHVDYMLISYVFYQYDLSIPHVCAGINLNFWPIGTLFRWSGGYFIRRSLPKDPLYSVALKAYVNELMREGYFQEFFFEGTRSRSGKLFPARTGLLSMMIEGFLEGGMDDLHFVPISIGYERVVEENSYLQEMKGAKKGREKFIDLFRLPKFLWRKYGKVYVQFGEPISLKSTLQGKTKIERPFIQDLAHQVGVEINRITTLLPSPLVAAVLLSEAKKSIAREEVHERVSSLHGLANRLGARMSKGLLDNCEFATEEILSLFVKEGLIRLHGELEEDFYTIPDESRLHLDFFKNKGIHVFAPLAVAQLCRRGGGDASADEAQLQNLLSREFYLNGKTLHDELDTPKWLYRLILPTLESYYLTLYSLRKQPFQKLDERQIIHRIQTLGETLRYRGDLQFSESLSRFPIQNALHKLIEYGLIKNHQDEMGIAGKQLFSFQENPAQQASLEELLKRLLRNAT